MSRSQASARPALLRLPLFGWIGGSGQGAGIYRIPGTGDCLEVEEVVGHFNEDETQVLIETSGGQDTTPDIPFAQLTGCT